MAKDTQSPWRGQQPVAGRPATTGLTLVEMALVLAIIALMAALFLPISSGLREAQQIKETRAKLAAIEAALTRFVMLNGRLPCPADGALADDAVGAGLEQSGATSSGCQSSVQSRAVVPWRTLGLTADEVLDAWGGRISYWPWMTYGTAGRSLTLATALGSCPSSTTPFSTRSAADWKSCLDALGPPRLGHRVLAPGSAAVLADPALNTGAAYVLISHGPNRFGGYTSSGVLMAGGPASVERQNDNGQPVKNNVTQGYYQGQASADFDDLVVWRTLMQVAVEAQKVQP
ncbi:MAG: type II secretion system protein [Tepidimonas sp.]|uniref:type II secretion system protein n=1 Tax=Tepidimonas sp. TaxID=2002775 RepID=UPI00259E7479|nr:type II secretion system protein [Tepidimonas sp.]MDM7456420.1 type II secretion system protein [Tepidimonas sp.]